MNSQLSLSDGCLVRLAQDGDAAAYNSLLQRYDHKIRQIIYFNVSDQANVSDITQEVFLKIVRHLSDFKEESKFSTWLYRIIQNTIKNYFRALSLRIDSEAEFAKEQFVALGASPEKLIMDAEFGALVEAALAQLSEELRLCYGLHIFEGHTYDAIAQRMHCPIGTVRSRIFRARKMVLGLVGNDARL